MLDVVGRVEIEFGGSLGRLVAEGQNFVLDVDEPSVLTGVVELGSLRSLAAALSETGFTLQVRSGDRQLLLAGHEAKTGILGRLLRLPRVQLDSRFALQSVLGRNNPRP
ncbi:MAG: hypothetical protein LH654_01360 [Thermoleophilia bacterium]|nr:hypothetical protein [Thermoleophilia bacterium]